MGDNSTVAQDAVGPSTPTTWRDRHAGPAAISPQAAPDRVLISLFYILSFLSVLVVVFVPSLCCVVELVLDCPVAGFEAEVLVVACPLAGLVVVVVLLFCPSGFSVVVVLEPVCARTAPPMARLNPMATATVLDVERIASSIVMNSAA